MIRIRRSLADKYAALRKRMIRETEIALLIGFRFPKRMPRIPTVEVGHGRFQPDFADQFWQDALELSDAEIDKLKQSPEFETDWVYGDGERPTFT